jgi:uncharacterized protein YeeX (DUF496 family)
MPYATWSRLWDLITKPPAAIAVYLTLLNIYFYPSSIDTVKDTVLSILLEHGLNAEELKIAQEALEVFIELTKHEKSAGADIEKLLKSIEQENYELFKKALYSYLKKDAPIEEVRRIIQAFITLRARTYARVYIPSIVSTDVGSYKISSSYDVTIEAVDDDYIIKDFNISMKRLRELGFFIILLEQIGTGIFSLIIPAPYTDMDIFKLFEKLERVGVERQEARAGEIEAVPSRFAGVKPSREILESIVAEALKGLGFAVQTDVRLPAKGGDIEVDVWATRNIGVAQFRVYVSCKNWDRDVDRTVIDHEFGRVLQLYQLPHLRILVVKSLTEPARKAAFDDGFFVIELGEKATTENAQEIYDIVYNKLKEIFIGIAPEKIMKAIERLKEAVKLLKEVM